MKRSIAILPALLLLLLVLPDGAPSLEAPMAPEASMEEALLDVASKAGYLFVRGNASHCPLDCESGVDACRLENRHKTQISDRAENELGKGHHDYCITGTCADHEHHDCDPQLATTIQLFEAISVRDWAGLRQVIDRYETVAYNAQRQAIQGLDCNGDHIGVHLQAPLEFVAFLEAQALQ